MQRIRCLAHNDLDGESGGAIVTLAHPDDHVVLSHNHYSDINQELLKALTEKARPYDRIVLVDIAMEPPGESKDMSNATRSQLINQELPEAIAEYVRAGGQLVVLDHHPRALLVKAYYGRWLHGDSLCETADKFGVKRAGSELAARYYMNLREFRSHPRLNAAVAEWGRLTGAYDCFRQQDKDWDMGCRLAMAESLMFDPAGAHRDMLTILEQAAGWPAAEPFNWSLLMQGTCFGAYYEQAPSKFEEMVTAARRTMIRHSAHVVEIYCTAFESLIAKRIYDQTHGIVAIRYTEERHLAKKLSFRSGDFGMDLGKTLQALGRGNGHAHSAGAGVDDFFHIDRIVDFVVENAEDYMSPTAA